MADPTVTVKIKAKDEASQTADKVEGRFTRMSNSIKANALKITAALGAMVAVFRTVETSATLAGQTEALERNLAAQGQSFDAFIAKLKEVSNGTVSTAQLIESSSKALLLGIPADQISELLEVAAASAVATGTSVSKAFDDIATGIGRAAPMILDNLGIVVKLGPAYADYAKELGKTTETLTAAEQKQALLNEVLRVGRDRVTEYGDAMSEATLRILQSRAAMENFKNEAGTFVSGVGLALAALVTRSAEGFVYLGRAIVEVVGAITGLLSYLPLVGRWFRDISNDAKSLGGRLGSTARSMQDLANRMSEGADATLAAQLGLDKSGESAVKAANDYQKAADAAKNLAGASSDAKTATEELGVALGVVTSIELSREIDKINESLAKSRDELGANSDEYVRLEQLASEKIENLQERILNLKDGLGDLKGITSENADAFIQYGEAAATAADRTAVFSDRVNENVIALKSQADATRSSGLFPGLSGAQYSVTVPVTPGQLQFTGGGYFYQGRKVKVLADGRVEWA